MRSSLIDVPGFEQVTRIEDESVGLDALVAIHDTTLGPALGGIRMLPYDSFDHALSDVLRLAEGMTYKFAIAGGHRGGGKCVVMADPNEGAKTELLAILAEYIKSLNGRYVPGIDSGTTQDDLRAMGASGAQVSCTGADPSPFTALGVHTAIVAAIDRLTGSPNLSGRKVVVQGLGHVGTSLVQQLVRSGAEVVVADLREELATSLARELGVRTVIPDEAPATACDVYAPCALGGAINDRTLDVLDARAVAGAANNVLTEPRHGEELHQRGVLYAPDFCANAGGIIFVDEEFRGTSADSAAREVRRIGPILERVWERSDREDRPAADVALAVASERLAAARTQ